MNGQPLLHAILRLSLAWSLHEYPFHAFSQRLSPPSVVSVLDSADDDALSERDG